MICCLFFTTLLKSLLTCATDWLQRRHRGFTAYLSNSQPFLCVAVCPWCLVTLHTPSYHLVITLYLKLLYLTFHESLLWVLTFFYLFILLLNLSVYSNLFVFIDLCVAHEARFGCTNTTSMAEHLSAVLLGVWLLLDWRISCSSHLLCFWLARVFSRLYIYTYIYIYIYKPVSGGRALIPSSRLFSNDLLWMGCISCNISKD
jgi:hypothetical protein